MYIAAISSQEDAIVDMLQSLTSRLEKLETRQLELPNPWPRAGTSTRDSKPKFKTPSPQPPHRGPITCRKCDLAKGRAGGLNPSQQQGN